MKTILIATDFSKAAKNAMMYGIEFAKAIQAKVILFNAYAVPHPSPGLTIAVSKFDVKAAADSQLEQEAEEINFSLELCSEEGYGAADILNLADEKNADYIITGMKGSGKNIKKIFGTTALSLARQSHIPVIVVPENAQFSSPTSIRVASDDVGKNICSHQALETFRANFNSTIHRVTVMTPEVKNKVLSESSASENFEDDMAADEHIEYTESESISSGEGCGTI